MEELMTFLLNVKLYGLKRDLPNLSFEQLKSTLYHTKWVVSIPESLCALASDIDSITLNDVTSYLTSDSNQKKYMLNELEGGTK